MKEEGFDDDYLPAPTHQRKARKATALQWTGNNEGAIAEFTHYATELHADSGWCYLRDVRTGALVGTIAPNGWVFYGEDKRLRVMRDEEFKSRYEVI